MSTFKTVDPSPYQYVVRVSDNEISIEKSTYLQFPAGSGMASEAQLLTSPDNPKADCLRAIEATLKKRRVSNSFFANLRSCVNS